MASDATTTAPVPGEVRKYPVGQPDGSERTQLILVTHVTEEGRVRGVPVGWEDTAADFPPGALG